MVCFFFFKPGPSSWGGRRGRPTEGPESGRRSGSRRWKCCGTPAEQLPAGSGVGTGSPGGRCPAWSGSCPCLRTGSFSGGCESFPRSPPACSTPPPPLLCWLDIKGRDTEKRGVRLRTQNSISMFTTLSATSAEKHTVVCEGFCSLYGQSLVFYHKINARINTIVMQGGLEVTSFWTNILS